MASTNRRPHGVPGTTLLKNQKVIYDAAVTAWQGVQTAFATAFAAAGTIGAQQTAMATYLTGQATFTTAAALWETQKMTWVSNVRGQFPG